MMDSFVAMLPLFALVEFIVLILVVIVGYISLLSIRKKNVMRFSLLVKTAKVFRKDRPLKKAFPIILEEITQYVPFIKASAVLIFSGDDELKVQSLVGIGTKDFESLNVPKTILSRVKKNKKVYFYNFKSGKGLYRGFIACPLQVQDNVVGVFLFLYKKRFIASFYLEYLEALTYQISLEFEDRLLQTKLDAFSKGLSMVEYSYERIVDNLPTGVTVVDPEGRILLWNKTMTAISNKDVDDAVGQMYSSVFQNQKEIADFFNEVRQKNELIILKDFNFSLEKQKKILEITGYPLYDFQENVVAYVIMHWDITSEKELAQRLKETQQRVNEQLKEKVTLATKEISDANQELLRLNAIKSEFVSVISHELKTPLTSIKGYVALLLSDKMGEMSSKQKNALEIVEEQSDRLSALIADILDLSKLESGKTTLQISDVDMQDIIRNVVDVMKPQADEKSISITVDTQPCIVKGDKLKIHQVLLNLASNAVKFTNAKGNVTFVVSEERGLCKIKVIDTGIGMTDEQASHLFEPFYQVEDHMTRNVSGTGLGLTIVKHIVELHKGTINVETKPDEGTTISVVLPTRQ